MRRDWIEWLACPLTRAPYDLDPVRVADREVVEAFLVSQDEREVRPVMAGVAILPRDLRTHLREQGSVYRRSPINDSRLGRFLIGRAGTGYDVVPFDLVVGGYRDLASHPPEGYDTSRLPVDLALAALVGRMHAGERAGRALVVGCGVGRSVFDLCVHYEAVLGVDRSVACARRARNVAVTREHFFLPAPKESGLKEIPLDLSRLVRDGADFAVADPDALPLQDDACALVVLGAGDLHGPWPEPAAAVREAQRVLAPGGLLVWHEEVSADLPPRRLGGAVARTETGVTRPLLHAATGLLALTLGLLPHPWHLVCAGLGVVAGWIVFPLTGLDAQLRRPGEPFLGGLRTYPIAVLMLVILLPRAEAAAAWGVLAFGDAAAAIVGRRVPAPAILGHPKATWSGSAAYLLVGGLAAWGLSAGAAAFAHTTGWVTIDLPPSALACFAAAGAAALIDLVPLPPDDNLPAAVAAGGVLHALRVLT